MTLSVLCFECHANFCYSSLHITAIQKLNFVPSGILTGKDNLGD